MGVPKTYIYISETKVDQFFEQLASSDIEKLGAEYGVDVKIFKWVGHREAERILTKQMRLNRVVEFLGSDELGSPSAPLRYFAGVLQMRWGALYDKAVIFVGETSKEIVVMAGALNHVIGVAGPPAGGIGASRKVGAVQIFSEAIDKALLSDNKEAIHCRPRTPRENPTRMSFIRPCS